MLQYISSYLFPGYFPQKQRAAVTDCSPYHVFLASSFKRKIRKEVEMKTCVLKCEYISWRRPNLRITTAKMRK